MDRFELIDIDDSTLPIVELDSNQKNYIRKSLQKFILYKAPK